MDYSILSQNIKKSFCNLTNFKARTNSLEVITPFSTINNKFVSVFITFTKGKYVITDNGWIDENFYDTYSFDEYEDIIQKIKISFQESFLVKSTIDKSGKEFFYKSTENVKEIPSLILDLANFTVGIVNSYCIKYKDEKEETEKETFRQDANNFLSLNYQEKVQFRDSLDDLKKIKFNAIIKNPSEIFLITYVTGSTTTYFENDLRKSIVNFELTNKTKYNKYIKEKLTIINDLSDGYSSEKSKSIIDLLNEKTTKEVIKWSEKEQILQYI